MLEMVTTHLKMRLTYNLQSDRHIIFQIISRYGNRALWWKLCSSLKIGAGHIKFLKKGRLAKLATTISVSLASIKSESRLKYCLWNLRHCIRFSISSERSLPQTSPLFIEKVFWQSHTRSPWWMNISNPEKRHRKRKWKRPVVMASPLLLIISQALLKVHS